MKFILIEGIKDEPFIRCLIKKNNIKADIKIMCGKGKIIRFINRLLNNRIKYSIDTVICFIDRDKKSLIGLNNYKITSILMESVPNLALFKVLNSSTKRYVYVFEFVENIEEFLLTSARSIGIRPEEYGLYDDPKSLHRINVRKQHIGYIDFVNRILESHIGTVLFHTLVQIISGKKL